jgi:hypothetical protein
MTFEDPLSQHPSGVCPKPAIGYSIAAIASGSQAGYSNMQSYHISRSRIEHQLSLD